MNNLTQRELETIKLVAQGYTNHEIATALGISHHTVKFHVSNLIAKLEVDGRAEVAVCAVRAGLA